MPLSQMLPDSCKSINSAVQACKRVMLMGNIVNTQIAKIFFDISRKYLQAIITCTGSLLYSTNANNKNKHVQLT